MDSEYYHNRLDKAKVKPIKFRKLFWPVEKTNPHSTRAIIKKRKNTKMIGKHQTTYFVLG